MHELAIAQGIIRIVDEQAREKGFQRVQEIRLKMGEFSGLVPACLREFFPVAAAGTAAEGAVLVIETLPARFRCLDCGYEGPVDRSGACCPDCRSPAIRMLSGREFYVDSLKVE